MPELFGSAVGCLVSPPFAAESRSAKALAGVAACVTVIERCSAVVVPEHGYVDRSDEPAWVTWRFFAATHVVVRFPAAVEPFVVRPMLFAVQLFGEILP